MTPRCRRSARIASNSKRSTESPAPPKLSSVIEINDSSTSSHETSSRVDDDSNNDSSRTLSSPIPNPTTPSTTVPPKLAKSEMHPSKFHQTMAAPSSGLRHGFTDIDYTKTPMQTLLQNTPSKTPVPVSEFTFRYTRPGAAAADLGLTPEARRLMDSVRAEAAKLRPQLAAELARERAEQAEAEGRKIAAAKGKSGRFSAVHMAEFKKMDSIEGHASSFRAAPGRSTPVKSAASTSKPITPLKPGVKRSQSKANLDEPEPARSKTVPRPLARPIEKRSEAPEHPSKRLRHRLEDDASTLRPVSRDGTSIPRPKSSGTDSIRSGIPRSHTVGSLMTPTKSSLARVNSIKTPTVSLVRSPSQPDLQKKGFGSLRKWGATSNSDTQSVKIPAQIETPGRFDRLKSILKRHASGTKKSAIPQPSTSVVKTPTRGLTDKSFPDDPLTTPGRKRVDFTPDTKRMVISWESPSPVKPSIPRSTTLPKFQAPKFVAGGKGTVGKQPAADEVTYPDLSAYGADIDISQPKPVRDSGPSTFTFRSDHTISFNDSPSKTFGSSAGQASLRQVRESTAPSIRMPGSFPSTSEASPNKENKDPMRRKSIPHGMANKKRHRASSDEDADDEGAQRGAKKLRKHGPVAEGYALVAPKLVAQSSPVRKAVSSTPQTPSPQKKKKTGGLSLSRLNMLAQPKIRK
ncbi:hypothetical protein F5Y03DRAFT_388720 [Xylaria venustula]|nr:hypothetical protein F5Y03DRAFT_388720 [Xylaria venustula]